jgi:hypothetical protein
VIFDVVSYHDGARCGSLTLRDERVSEGWLRDAYISQQKTCRQIASEWGRNPNYVHDCLKRFGIPTRPRGIAPKRAGELFKDRDWLYNAYVTESRSAKDLARQFNCSATTIKRWLDNLGIDSRSKAQATDLSRRCNHFPIEFFQREIVSLIDNPLQELAA